MQRLINVKIAKGYQTIAYDATCLRVGVWPIQITTEQKVQTYMTTKTNNLEYDAPLEVNQSINQCIYFRWSYIQDMENVID